MNKNTTSHLPDDLEKELHDYHASPEPRTEFVSRLERDLHSKLKEQEKNKMFGKSAKLKWGLGFAFAAVLIGLLVTSPTVAAAMKRLLTYIPGIGLVDSGSEFRVLAEPVTQTRDGVTVTIKEMVLSADKTIIIYTMEGIPFEALSHQENVTGCNGIAEIRLPDGGSLRQMSGSATGWGTGMEMRFLYDPIPSDVNEATLFIPCIQGTLTGTLPENWKLLLRFIPAPPDMTQMPVIEVMPSGEAVSDNPLILEKVVETETGYILIGKFDATKLDTETNILGISEGPKIIDANGGEVQFTTPNDVEISTNEMGVFPWAYQLEGKQFAWPLTITLEAVDGEGPHSQTGFDFDTGPNPQAGQEWTLDRGLQLGEYSVTLTSIRFNGDGYTFKFQSSEKDANVNVSVEIIGSTPAGGGGGGDGSGYSESSMMYAGEPPTGKLSLVFHSQPIIQIRGPWQLEWQPEDASLLPAPAPMEVPDVCLTLDSWKAALANPQPIPADLTGKVSVYGRIIEDGQNPSPDNYGVYVANLDGSGKQVVGQGVWPSLSPDGTQIAYAWGDGLYLADLASGESHLIPNTLESDYGPRWSQDGRQIAFMRIDDFNLYVINPDGTGLKKVIDGIDYELLIGWSPDGTGLFYGVNTQGGILLNQLDIASGANQELFAVDSKGLEVSLSPDGTRFAFRERSGSTMSHGVYTSALDGSDRKLIAQMGNWLAVRPVWSPDGKWLLMGILNAGDSNTETVSAAVNLQTCQIVPLPLSGDVSSWVR